MLFSTVEPDFYSLVDDTFEMMGVQLPPMDLEDEDIISIGIEIDKVLINLVYAEAVDSANFKVYCAMGPLPEKATPVMRKVLEMNAMSSLDEGGIFAINPHSHQMTFIRKICLEEIDVQLLAASLTMMAKLAKEWRKSYFLDRTPDLTVKDVSKRSAP